MVFLCFFVAHLISLKQLLGILYQVNSRLFVFGVSYLKISVLLVALCFLDFSCSSKSRGVVFTSAVAVTSSSLRGPTLGGKFLSALLGILRLWGAFSRFTCTLASSCGTVINFCAFSGFCRASLCAHNFPFPSAACPGPAVAGWLHAHASWSSAQAHS